MVVRYKPFAALAAVVAPVAAAHGAGISELVPAVQTPSFQCNAAAAGGSINWGDGASMIPELGFALDATSLVTFNPMDCASTDGGIKFSDSLVKLDSLKNQDKYFALKLTPAAINLSDFTLKFDKFTPVFGDLQLPGGNEAKFWDLTLKFLKYDSAGDVVGSSEDFLGLKIDAPIGAVGDGTLKLDSAGNLELDPSFTGSSGSVSLYAAPLAPTAVPEPGTLVMLGTGLLGIGAAVRRRLGW